MNSKRIKLAISISIISLLTGCAAGAPSYSVKYMAEPDGATIFCDGKSYGFAPATVKWVLPQSASDAGVIRVGKCESIWVSGAKASYDSEFSLRKMPYGAEQKTYRHRDDRYYIDAEYALNKENMRINKKNSNKTTICNNVYGTIICN